MKFLSDTAQTAYSSLLQKAFDTRYALLSGLGFVSKTLSGKKYWYCQYTDIAGKRKQRYMGEETPELVARIQEMKRTQEVAEIVLDDRKRLVAMVVAGGGHFERGRAARIMEKLSDAGVFDGGGMLIGSYAFSCYGNMLGVSFEPEILRTEDMDVAYDRSIEIGFVRDIRQDVTEAEPGIREPKQINPWVPPYELVAPDGFKLEFLTTMENAADKAPTPVERFGINAQPLEFMDYLIDQPVPAVVLYGSGIPVQVPNPARYALHKLAIALRRPAHNPEKRRKDLAQAEALIEYFMEESPGELLLACDAALSRSDTFSVAVEMGMKASKNHELMLKLKQEYWKRATSRLQI